MFFPLKHFCPQKSFYVFAKKEVKPTFLVRTLPTKLDIPTTPYAVKHHLNV